MKEENESDCVEGDKNVRECKKRSRWEIFGAQGETVKEIDSRSHRDEEGSECVCVREWRACERE